MQFGSTDKGITYTSLAKIAKLGEGLNQNGKTIDQDLRIHATITAHAEARQLPLVGYHHIWDAEGNALVLIIPRGKDEGVLQFDNKVIVELKGTKISSYKGTTQL